MWDTSIQNLPFLLSLFLFDSFPILCNSSMEASEELQLRNRAFETDQISHNCNSAGHGLHLSRLKNYQWWIRVTFYVTFLLCGQSAAILLGRLYYDKGGDSKWMATFVQSAGFPILLPFLCFFPTFAKSTISATQPKPFVIASVYIIFGLLLAGDNMMYSYGLLYLPVSTYSLLCATQLAFSAVFSFFLNSQKLTPFILISIILLTISASLLAFNPKSEHSSRLHNGKYWIGFICTVGASAAYALYLSLLQLTFEKAIKTETDVGQSSQSSETLQLVGESLVDLPQSPRSSFKVLLRERSFEWGRPPCRSDAPTPQTFSAVLNMQIYPSFMATCCTVVGLFASGEWKTLPQEMKEYEEGRVSYAMTLVSTAVMWQISSIVLLGLVFEASSLFSNVVSTLALPVVPVLAVIFFHDKMDKVKVMALVFALWGFISYIYKIYLDEKKARRKTKNAIEEIGALIEVC